MIDDFKTQDILDRLCVNITCVLRMADDNPRS